MLFPHFSSKFALCRYIHLSQYPSFLPQVSPSLLSQLLSYYVHLCPPHTLHGLSTPSSVTQDRKIIVMEDRQMRESRKECGGSSAAAEGRQMKRGLCHCQRTAPLLQTHTALSHSPILVNAWAEGAPLLVLTTGYQGDACTTSRVACPLSSPEPGKRFPAPSPSSRFLADQPPPTASDQPQTRAAQGAEVCLHPLGHSHTSSKSVPKPWAGDTFQVRSFLGILPQPKGVP